MSSILFVDDEADVELLMKQRFRKELRNNVFTFYFARSGVEALKLLDEQKDIRMLISDINMPEMDGLTLLKNIQDKHPKVIPIIVSAYGDMANIRTAMNLGAFDFVTKPINFDDLRTTISKTTDHINHLIESETNKSKLDGLLHELNVASHIQQSILPTEFIDNESIDVFAQMTAAKQVGGDFYDFFWLDNNRLGFVMADVSGKGIAAALFMTVSRTLLRSHSQKTLSPGKCLTMVNEALLEDNDNMMFVTTFYGILDLSTKKIQYANGGHNPPFIIRQGGPVEILPSTAGTALGVMEGIEYKEGEFELNPGDVLFSYTDGVTEAENMEGSYFSEDRLAQVLDKLRDVTSTEIIAKVKEEVTNFAGECPQSDDITMLAIKLKDSVSS